MGLFVLGDFTLRSGMKSRWKIECDALTPEDWAALAAMAAEILPPFREAEGVPRGGLPFAAALNAFATGDPTHPYLVAEDVVTTGGSVEKFVGDRAPPFGRFPLGVCVFARYRCPHWITPLFRMPSNTK